MTITWQCNYCKDIITSDSNKRWSMDFCKCRKSAVDLEKDYSRVIGSVKELKRND